jgi:hypothetical protein
MVKVGRYLGRNDARALIAIRDPCRESPEADELSRLWACGAIDD